MVGSWDYYQFHAEEAESPELHKQFANTLSRFLNNNSRILDVGCGFGWTVKYLRELGYDAVGVDINEYMVKNAVVDSISLGDATDLQFDDNEFDCVISLQTLEHITSVSRAVSELKRVVKDGGLIVITTPKPRSPHADRDPTHVSIAGELSWCRLFNVLRQNEEIILRRDIKNTIIKSRAEYYASKKPSTLVGAILSKFPTVKRKLLEKQINKRNTFLVFEVVK